MDFSVAPSSRSRLRSIVLAAAAFTLGAALVGCGPEKPFCADASDFGYVCQTISDASRPEAEVNTPPPKDGPIVVGDDEDAGAPQN
jgi:hypothetical protein